MPIHPLRRTVAVLLVCILGLACSSKGASIATLDAAIGAAGAGAGSAAGSGENAGSGGQNVTNDDDAGNAIGDGGTSGNDSDSGISDTLDGGNVVSHGSGPGDWTAGDYPKGVHDQTYLEIKDVPGQAGNVRQYKVHVPASYDPNTPMPLVFCFHGMGQNAVMFCVDGSGMLAKSNSANFILVMPNGFQNSWNAGTCCGGAASMMLDDVALVRAIFGEVKRHLNVDLSRVYALGLSNGAYISYRLACQASDIFAAVAPGAGAIGMNDIGGGTSATGDFAECKPTHPVSVLDMHGTADGLIAYSTQKPTLERIAGENGCKLTTHAAAQPKSAGDTGCVSYDGCPAGVDVTACTVTGGGHVWFGDESCGTGAGAAGCGFVGMNSDTLVNTDAAWDFFRAHAR